MNVWKIAIDTGGTFTDCIAQDPTGVIYRTKVLSTGRLRGKITEIQNDGSVRIQQHWNLLQAEGHIQRIHRLPFQGVGYHGANRG